MTTRTRALPALLAALVTLALPRGARADEAPAFEIGPKPAWFLLGGITGGGTVGFVKDRGGFVGGELSLARVSEKTFAGLYADGYYDFGLGGTYVTGGIEAGSGFVGLDAGGAARFSGGTADFGPTARLFVTGLGLFTLYTRYAWFPAAKTDSQVLQVGVLLKVPFATFGGDR